MSGFVYWLACIEYKLLSLTYKVFTTTKPLCLQNLITVQPPRSTRSSSLATLARPSTSPYLRITDRSFPYASPRLWNQLPASLRQPRTNLSDCDSPSFLSGTSSVGSINSPLSSTITPSLFHVRLGVNNGSGDGGSCFGIEVWTDTAKLANMVIARFGDRRRKQHRGRVDKDTFCDPTALTRWSWMYKETDFSASGVAKCEHRSADARQTTTKAGHKMSAQTRGDFCRSPRPNRLVITRLPISSLLELQTAYAWFSMPWRVKILRLLDTTFWAFRGLRGTGLCL